MGVSEMSLSISQRHAMVGSMVQLQAGMETTQAAHNVCQAQKDASKCQNFFKKGCVWIEETCMIQQYYNDRLTNYRERGYGRNDGWERFFPVKQQGLLPVEEVFFTQIGLDVQY